MGSTFTDDDVAAAITGYLLYSNYQIHRPLAYHGSWNGLGELGVVVPSAWEPFQNLVREDHILMLLGRPQEPRPVFARLRAVANTALYTSGGSPGIYLYVPGDQTFLGTPSRAGFSRDVICRWLIPQLEYDANLMEAKLPDVYNENWSFDKVLSKYGAS
jgi:hypothetical protein